MTEFDFSGWATRNNLKCSDGRTIMKDAFKHNDGQTVPLVWNHQHDGPDNVLGHALLENKDEGVYAYCKFNETENGELAKILVKHKDVCALSIYANQLKQQGSNVLHGAIREVSLVYAGANPGAYIDSVMAHGETSEEEAIIYTGEKLSLSHAEDEKKEPETKPEEKKEEPKEPEKKEEDKDKETVADVFNTLNEKQKTVVYAMIGQALEEENELADNKNEDSKGGDNTMKHNVFDKQEDVQKDVLSHSDIEAISPDKVLVGVTAHDKSGAAIEGICTRDVDSSDATVAEAEILLGKTAYARGAKLTGTMPNRGAISQKITTKAQEVTVPQGYHDGSGKVGIDSTEQGKLVANNIRQGVTVLGVEGTLEPSSEVTSQQKSVTPSTAQQVVIPDENIDYLSQVTVAAIPYVESDNSAGGVTVTIAG